MKEMGLVNGFVQCLAMASRNHTIAVLCKGNLGRFPFRKVSLTTVLGTMEVRRDSWRRWGLEEESSEFDF